MCDLAMELVEILQADNVRLARMVAELSQELEQEVEQLGVHPGLPHLVPGHRQSGPQEPSALPLVPLGCSGSGETSINNVNFLGY